MVEYRKTLYYEELQEISGLRLQILELRQAPQSLGSQGDGPAPTQEADVKDTQEEVFAQLYKEWNQLFCEKAEKDKEFEEISNGLKEDQGFLETKKKQKEYMKRKGNDLGEKNADNSIAVLQSEIKETSRQKGEAAKAIRILKSNIEELEKRMKDCGCPLLSLLSISPAQSDRPGSFFTSDQGLTMGSSAPSERLSAKEKALDQRYQPPRVDEWVQDVKEG